MLCEHKKSVKHNKNTNNSSLAKNNNTEMSNVSAGILLMYNPYT
jgi:hypothetical protein